MRPMTTVRIGLFICLVYVATAVFAADTATWISINSMPEGSPPEAVVLQSSLDRTVILFEMPGYYTEELEADGVTYQIPRIPDAGMLTDIGSPELPVVTRWVAIPNTGGVEFDILAETGTQIPGAPVYPLQDVDEEYYPEHSIYRDNNVYDRDDAYPSSSIQISEPMIMRDLRVVAVSWIPIRTNPAQGGINVTSSIEIDIHTTGAPATNEKVHQHSRMTPSFYNIYRHNVINFDELFDEGMPEPGSVLIICPNNSQVTTRLQSLIDWKKRKGYSVTLATTAQTGTSYSNIKSYIQTAYNTWDPPLEYVILAGDAEGSYVVVSSTTIYDHGYTQLDGSDIIGDVAIGRLSFDNTTQLTNIVNKIVGYESNPYMGQTDWYTQAYFLAGTNHAYSTVIVKRYIRQLMWDAGIPHVTIRDYPTSTIPASEMRSHVNAGVLYLNYRGSWVNEMVCSHFQGLLSNGYMLPVAVGITCGTGTFTSSYSESVSECWLREGGLSLPAGAIGCISTATSGTHTRQNNIMDTGIFYGLFAKQLYNYGAALVEGKIQLVNAFPTSTTYQNNFSYWNNLMGDPSLDCWTGIPQQMAVTHPTQVTIGDNMFTVQVEDGSSNPIPGALVCLLKNGETFITEYTDDSGELVLPITVTTSGILKVTVTKHDYRPYLEDLTVITGDIVSPVDWDIDDDNSGLSQGNNNSTANPGETIELPIQLKNWGTSLAQNVTAILIEDDEYLTISQDSASYGNIASSGTAWSSQDYVISIAGNCPNEHLLHLFIDISASGRPTYRSMVPIVVNAADLEYSHRTLVGAGGDGKLDPGDTADIIIYLDNIGNFPASNVVGNLSSSHQLAAITGPTSSFGIISGTSTGNNSSDPFSVQMSPVIYPGQPVTFTVSLTGDGGFADTVAFEEIIGTPGSNDPTGPDDYGYWAFENVDTMYIKHPTYHWEEINTTGTLIPLTDYSENQDDSEVINLPFTFYFYGHHYARITVCSNGWIAFGDQGDIINFRNYPIPGAHGPISMVAAFWDDLVLGSGHVYYYYDSLAQRFIVEWNNVRTRYNNYLESFQVILYDPAFYTTPTGDGEILIQYQTVHNVTGDPDDIDFATVGIESPDQLDGIQYTYWNAYPSSAAGLAYGRAILFTTDSGEQGLLPDTLGPEISHVSLANTTDPTGPYPVDASIWDMSGIDYVDLNYSRNGTSFIVEPMSHLGGRDWSSSIPGQPPGTIVQYFISAVDDSGNYSQTDTSRFDVWDVIVQYSFEAGASGWIHYSNGGGWFDQWHISMEDAHSPVRSWKCGDSGSGSYYNLLDAYLESPEITLPSNSQMHFYHRIQSEASTSYPDSAYDGGIIEISCNYGPWEQV
ncbi:hypothetical protein AMJ86_02790, partial [bacterium SM23_57]